MAVNNIISHWWTKIEPHPCTVGRQDRERPNLPDNRLIRNVNEYHGYCVPCQTHIYTRREPADFGSYVSLHLNTQVHRVNALFYPRNRPLFSSGRCLACNVQIRSNPVGSRLPLNELLDQHINGGEHWNNTQQLLDREFVLLSALALLPQLADRVTETLCTVCKGNYFWEPAKSHLRSKQHVANVRQLLRKEYDFDVSLHLNEDHRVVDLWIKLGGPPQIFSCLSLKTGAGPKNASASLGEPSSRPKKTPAPGQNASKDLKVPSAVQNKKTTGAAKKEEDVAAVAESKEQQPSKKAKKEVKRNKKGKKVPYYRGIAVRPTTHYSIKHYSCDNCSKEDDLNTLPTHLEDCFLKRVSAHWVETSECGPCKLLIVYQGKTAHYESQDHKRMLEKIEERKKSEADARSKEQTTNLVMVKVLNVAGVPTTVADKLQVLHSTFKKFGRIAKVTLDDRLGDPTVQFWEQSAIKRALSGPPLFIGESQLTLTVKEMKISDIGSIGRVVTLADEVARLLQDKEALEAHCWELSRKAMELRNDSKEKARTELLLEDLLKGLRNKRGRPLALVFGSRDTGLTLDRNSDIDVFFGTRESFFAREYQSIQEQKDAVLSAAFWLQKSKLASGVKSIVNARVPIVTFTHRASKLKCDLSFRNGLSCRNTDWQCLMMKLDDRVRPMVMYLKEWIRCNGFTNLLTSYAATVMVLVYLANLEVPVLPTLHSLRGPNVEEIFIGDWNTSFQEDVEAIGWKSKNTSTVVELLSGFFRFYAELDYSENFIYPAEALILPREILISADGHLPDELRKQIKHVPLVDYAPNIDIAIMDPFDLSYNLTRRIHCHAFHALVECLRLSSVLLADDH